MQISKSLFLRHPRFADLHLLRKYGTVNLAYNSYEMTNHLPGPDENTSPIVIMHGLLGSKSNWTSLAKAIHMKTKRQVVTIDARNHGDSPHADTMDYPSMAEDILALLDSLFIDKATLIGHSMGGRTMMTVALTEPSVVDKLVVVDVSPIDVSPTINELTKIIEALQQIRVSNELPRSAARKEADKQLMEVVTNNMLRQFLLTNLVEDNGSLKWRINLPAIAKDFMNIVSFPNYRTKFEGETLFIGGENSDYIRLQVCSSPTLILKIDSLTTTLAKKGRNIAAKASKEDHEAIRHLFPRAEFTYIAGAGHWVHSEKTNEFLQEALKFLNRR